MDEKWLEEAERYVLFKQGTRGSEASKLLEISATNRNMSSRHQAIICQVCRVIESAFTGLYQADGRYKDLTQITDRVEEHQLTMNGYSREQFIKVATPQEQLKAKLNKEIETVITK